MHILSGCDYKNALIRIYFHQDKTCIIFNNVKALAIVEADTDVNIHEIANQMFEYSRIFYRN